MTTSVWPSRAGVGLVVRDVLASLAAPNATTAVRVDSAGVSSLRRPGVSIGWAALDTAADEAHVAEPFCAALQRDPESRPLVEAHLPKCRARYYRAAGRVPHLVARAREVGEAMASHGIRAIALKGLALSTIYPDSAARPMTDIDLLVARDALPCAEAVLVGLGYRSAVPARRAVELRLHHHHLPPLRHESHGDVIELHHALLPAATGVRPNVASLCERAMPCPALAPLHVLALEDQVLHLSLHLLAASDVVGRLRQLLDVHVLLARTVPAMLDWDRLRQRAEEWGAAALTASALRLSRAIFGTPVPRSALAVRPTRIAARQLRDFRRALLADLGVPCDEGVRERLARRKLWLERPSLKTAVRIGASALRGVVSARRGTSEL